MPDDAPRIFLSYSHDSDEHRERVLALADRLRADGIDAHLDQYELAPAQGWPNWVLAHAWTLRVLWGTSSPGRQGCRRSQHERAGGKTDKSLSRGRSA